MFTNEQILASNEINQAAKQWAIDNIAYLNKPMRFLGSSMKVEKGKDKFDTYIMYLQPASKVSVKTLCAGAMAGGCEAPCLISSGQLGMSVGQRAATKRTIIMLLDPIGFRNAIISEIDRAERKALKTGIPALFRLNGTSDTDFSAIIAQRPNSQFYDYTKILSRVRKNTLANYDLTFSGSMYSTQSKIALSKAVMRGYRIAVAFNSKGIKSDTLAIPAGLVSFDSTDLRHLDSKGIIGTLTRKGSSKVVRDVENTKSASFFITKANVSEFNNIIARG
jgi:hypothetical protein